MGHHPASKQPRMSSRLSGARAAICRSFVRTGKISTRGSGIDKHIPVISLATENSNDSACRNLVFSSSLG